MHGIMKYAAAIVATLATGAVALPSPIQARYPIQGRYPIQARAHLKARPGGVEEMEVTELNTINSTLNAGPQVTTQSNPLEIAIVNNFGGTAMTAWVTGHDTNGNAMMLGTDGAWYYPDAAGSEAPIEITASVSFPLGEQGSTTTITLPDYMSSGRVWVADGALTFYTVLAGDGSSAVVEPSPANPEDPSAGVNWGFVELTNTETAGIYANISFVDFVGLVISMALSLGSGETQTVQGLRNGAVADICADLAAQTAADGQPWDEMCITDAAGTPLRIQSPNLYLSNNPTAMADYYDEYIAQVWEKYATATLTIDTQSDAGAVACSTSAGDGLLYCDGDNRGYPQPTVIDIWGCNSGPFAIVDGDNAVHRAVVPRLCAAFVRSTLLVDGGDVQPALGADAYYQADPTNHYSRIVHAYETDGLGYTFPYDDVNPSGENAAGVVAGLDPRTLTLTVGGL
ncbi:glycoside hydrolase family 64 protein [Xylariomycetidae sp. FL0641]|nr:glycoside hydrolase family 64 protein [Xylariomycetidae sp. FL0641]